MNNGTLATRIRVDDRLTLWAGEANGCQTRVLTFGDVGELYVDPVHSDTTMGVRLVDKDGTPFPASMSVRYTGPSAGYTLHEEAEEEAHERARVIEAVRAAMASGNPEDVLTALEALGWGELPDPYDYDDWT